jgi:hypothetical protein
MAWSKYSVYIVYDKPVPYKNLLIYPATMEDYFYFHWYSNCLLVDKNSIPDVNIISMSYWDYLVYATVQGKTDEEKMYLPLFNQLMKLVLRKENLEIKLFYDSQTQKPVFKIDDQVFNGDDFEEIRNIIIEQNVLELPDETIQKEIRDKMEEAQKLRQKMNNNKICSLEDQLICVMISTPMKLEDLYKLSIRKFSKVLERVDAKLHYEIYLSASMSGFVTFKDKSALKHWMTDLTKDKLGENTIEMDKLKKDLGKGNTAVFQ